MSKLLLLLVIVLGNAFIGCAPAERADLTNPVTNAEANKPSVQPTPDELPSDQQFEEWRKDSFRPVIEKWLRGERLPRHVELDPENHPYAGVSQSVASTSILDVNGDGKKELAMQSGCAVVGNCEFWLYEKVGDGYRQLLNAAMVQQFELRKTRTNNYYDLETSAHDSAASGGLAIYKYNGTEYKIAECFGYEYELTGKFNNGKR